MISAVDARTESIANINVETEIFIININILNAITSGQLNAIVAGATETYIMDTMITGSPMTTSQVYYDSWQSVIINPPKTSEMNKVIDYFTKLGYAVSRQSNDGMHIFWNISW